MIAGMAAMGTMAALPFGQAMAETGSSPFAGVWSGTLQAGPTALRLQLEIGPDLKAVVTSIDQGNARLPAQGVKADAKSITILIPTVGASYEAELTETGGLKGRFTQAGQTFPLAMERGAAAAPAPASGKPEAMSAQQLHALRAKLGTPGVGAGWQRGQAAPTILVDGLRSAEASLPVESDDRWHIGSIGKSITATLAARAVEAGMIGWGSSVSSVLGKEISDIHPGFAEVSLLHLLSHRSGLPPAAGEDRLADFSPVRGDDIHGERIRLARAVLSVASATPMGTATAYANAGYVVASAMLETLTGKPWEVLVREHVFGPLGLKSAGIGLPGKQGAVDQPLGHTVGAGGKRIPHFTDLPAVLGPAGLVHMSLADLLAYLAAHRDGNERLLTKESWQKLHTAPFGGDYALGWVVLPNGMLMHNGSNGSWLATGVVDPKGGIAAAFAGNDAAAMAMQGAIIQSLLSAARGAGPAHFPADESAGKSG
jgi:CubicO group peptidase (beta-lactamase class C family)